MPPLRHYIAAFPVLDDSMHVSQLLDEAQDALDGLLADDGLARVGRLEWDLQGDPLRLVVIGPVIDLEESAA